MIQQTASTAGLYPHIQEPSAPLLPALPVLDAELVPDPDERLWIPRRPRIPRRLRIPRRPRLLRRLIDDPYWLVMTGKALAVCAGVALAGAILYGAVEVVLAVEAFLALYGREIIAAIVCLILLALLCAGGRGGRRGGGHCPGCR